jgi:HEAT repeat protein
MFPDFPQPISPQPQLFLLEESIGTLELFPAVWSALEDLTKADPEVRLNALEQLIELNAPRFSPVVSYILVTKITESTLELRARIIEVLGKVLTPDENGFPAPEEVRSSLHLYLSGFRTRQIYALLQVSAEYYSLEEHVSRLLNACPFAGNHLIDILNDSKTAIDIRMQAAVMIGQVGYLYTLPALEKLSRRLEARISGQKTMDFAPQRNSIESSLLPVVNEALRSLRSP